MTRLRLRKLLRDLWSARGRAAMMVVAVTVSLAAVAAVLTARSVLAREITRNYLDTHPASATLEVPGGLDRSGLDAVRVQPGVTDATMRALVQARMRIGDRWEQLQLFVIDPDDPMRISTLRSGLQHWPPPDGLLLERSTIEFFGLHPGDTVDVQTPKGTPTPLTVTASAHDPALAPSQQETVGYGYLTPAALRHLGEPPVLDDLKLVVGEPGMPARDPAVVERAAQQVASMLAARGVTVERIELPPPYRHPHQRQMETVVALLLVFGLLALLLSAVLVATILNGLLAQHIRQIGVMKALGASTGQVLRLYLLMTLLIAAAATALAMLPGVAAGRWLATTAAGLLNIDLVDGSVPAWVYAVVVAAGIGVPQLVALVPLVRGSRITVRQAIDDHGVTQTAVRAGRRDRWPGRLPGDNRSLRMAWRNMFRRRGRLALSLGLLAAAGAMFVTGLNSAEGWTRLVDDGIANRHYDLEVRLNQPADPATVETALGRLPGVAAVEAWTSHPTEATNPGQVDVSHTYPDTRHGSLSITALPPDTSMLHLPLRAGRWLDPDDTSAVVVNQGVAPILGDVDVDVDDRLTLTVAGQSSTWHVVGTVADFGTQATAYVTERGMAAATGLSGQAQTLRITTTAHDDATRLAVLNRVEQALAADAISVQWAMPVTQLQTALDGHVAVLIAMLLALAGVLAVVGLLGLAATMSTNVTERTREFGVLHAIGATPTAVRRIVLTEAALTAATSVLIALAVALPLTILLGNLIGNQAFLLPLPVAMSLPGIVLWIVVAVGGAAAATLAAARRAGRLTIQEALTVT